MPTHVAKYLSMYQPWGVRSIIQNSLLFWCILFASAETSFSAGMNFYDAGNGGNCSSCVWLAADGEITLDTPEKFQSAAGGRKGLLVRINSKGGNPFAAIELGRLFRKYETVVEVAKTEDYDGSLKSQKPGECYSACVLALMGGVYRQKYDIQGNSVIGIHRPYTEIKNIINTKALLDNIIRESQIVSGYILEYIFEMGIDTKIFTRMMQTEKDDIDILKNTELVDFNVINNVWSTEPWKISLEGNRPVAKTFSRFGKRHVATLEYRCSSSGKDIISFGVELPKRENKYILEGMDASELIGNEISISINTEDLDEQKYFKTEKAYIFDNFVYTEVQNKYLLNVISSEKIIYTSLYRSMTSTRQYDLFEMMSPHFSLEKSYRAISLIQSGC